MIAKFYEPNRTALTHYIMGVWQQNAGKWVNPFRIQNAPALQHLAFFLNTA